MLLVCLPDELLQELSGQAPSIVRLVRTLYSFTKVKRGREGGKEGGLMIRRIDITLKLFCDHSVVVN